MTESSFMELVPGTKPLGKLTLKRDIHCAFLSGIKCNVQMDS